MHTRGGAGSHTHAPPPTNGRTCLGDGRAWAVIPSPRRLRACVIRGNETTVGRVRTSNFYGGRCASPRPTWRGTRARRQRRWAARLRGARRAGFTLRAKNVDAGAPRGSVPRRRRVPPRGHKRHNRRPPHVRAVAPCKGGGGAAQPTSARSRAACPPPPCPPLLSLFRGGCAAAGVCNRLRPAPRRAVACERGEAARGCTGGAVGDGTAQRFCP